MINRASKALRTHLLGLPAEIRNEIYRLVLVEQHAVAISPRSPPPPGLLEVCYDIRDEAQAIYACENSFMVTMVNYEPFLMFEWYAALRSCCTRKNVEVNLVLNTTGQPNWDNLLLWCHGVHEKSMPGIVWTTSSADMTTTTISSMHRIAEEMVAVPWEQVEPVLEAFRNIFVAVRPAWALDGWL